MSLEEDGFSFEEDVISLEEGALGSSSELSLKLEEETVSESSNEVKEKDSAEEAAGGKELASGATLEGDVLPQEASERRLSNNRAKGRVGFMSTHYPTMGLI